MPQLKKQVYVTKAIPKKAANSKASAKLKKATVPRTDSITTNEVERAKSVADSDYEVPLVPEGGAPALAPTFNATPHKDIQFISGFKIFDEVLVNAADNKLEDANKVGTYCQGYPKDQECEMIQFFTMKEYQQWSINPENNAIEHNVRIHFKPMQVDEYQIINLAFSKQEADAYKEWLHQYHSGTYIAR
ncbi:DNA topoisomerase 2, partial [Massospora cicadina]